jgi:hypothetical protein
MHIVRAEMLPFKARAAYPVSVGTTGWVNALELSAEFSLSAKPHKVTQL